MLMRTADRALSLVLRLLLAGCLCCPLVLGLYGLHVARQITLVGFSDDCLADACLWLSDGDWNLTFPPAQPCWRAGSYGYGYSRPC